MTEDRASEVGDPTDEIPEKRVTWAELYFDLVFVFAVTEVSALLLTDHSLAGVGRAAVLFVPVYWSWVGTTVHANTTPDVNTPRNRLGIFAIALCSLFMALATPHAFGDRAVLFAVAFLVQRVVLALMAAPVHGYALNPMSVAVFVTGPLRLVGTALPSVGQQLLWAVAAVIDLATPLLTRARLNRLPFHPGHLPERFGLFVIIALGESIVGIGLPAAESEHLDATTLTTVGLAFVLATALWWIYYAFAADAIAYAMRTAAVRTDLTRQVLSYGHLALLAGIIAVAVGLHEVLAHPGGHLSGGTVGLLHGGCALYLATFTYTRWHMFHKVSVYRLAGALVAVALIPLAGTLPAVLALTVLSAVLVAVNGVEHVVFRRAGG